MSHNSLIDLSSFSVTPGMLCYYHPFQILAVFHDLCSMAKPRYHKSLHFTRTLQIFPNVSQVAVLSTHLKPNLFCSSSSFLFLPYVLDFCILHTESWPISATCLSLQIVNPHCRHYLKYVKPSVALLCLGLIKLAPKAWEMKNAHRIMGKYDS
jgi:hypothetical protein